MKPWSGRSVRLWITAAVLVAQLAHLAWEHFHGGVASHHVLRRADLPAISNWWGAVVLPLLTWFLTGRIQRRVVALPAGSRTVSGLPWSVVAGFCGALLVGAVIAGSFAIGAQGITSWAFQAMLVLALFLPAYRAESLLGFVLGMTLTFGAVLPTAIGSIVAAGSALIHLVLRPLIVRGWRWIRRAR